jgi:hypothetical protein
MDAGVSVKTAKTAETDDREHGRPPAPRLPHCAAKLSGACAPSTERGIGHVPMLCAMRGTPIDWAVAIGSTDPKPEFLAERIALDLEEVCLCQGHF